MPVVGFLSSESPALFASFLGAFTHGHVAGFVAGQNVAIEYRWAQGQNERLPNSAAELVQRQVGVIAARQGRAPGRNGECAQRCGDNSFGSAFH
jgi:putative ABC transport system substrate-binding protein